MSSKNFDSKSEKSFTTCSEYRIQIPGEEFSAENQRIKRTNIQIFGHKLRSLFTSWKFWCSLFVLLVAVLVINSIIMATTKEKTVYIETISNCTTITQSTPETTTTEQASTNITTSTTKKPWNPVK